MSGPSRLAVVYADDESLAIRCDGDISILTPNANLLAAGADGAFDPSDRWTLSSETNDFEAQGVAVGNTIKLSTPSTVKPPPFGPSGTLFAIGAVSGSTVTLRRLGEDDGFGMPPAPAAGMTGVVFAVETLGPQIEQASDEINRRFGIDPNSPTRAPANIYDLRELREATMLTVLLRKYTGDVRTKDGAMNTKIKELTNSLDDSLSRLSLRWGSVPDAPPPPSPKFTTRASR